MVAALLLTQLHAGGLLSALPAAAQAAIPPQCSDGVDNDGDGLIDFHGGSTTVIEHNGATNPETEGWTRVVGPGSPDGPVVNDQGSGVDAWFVDDNWGQGGAFLNTYFKKDFSAAQIAQAQTRGWKMTARLRVVDIPDPIAGNGPYSVTVNPNIGGQDFVVHFGTEPDGDPIVRVSTSPGGGTGESYTLQGANGGYHLYELVFDPQRGAADLYVDGVKRLTDLQGYQWTASNSIGWGSGSNPDVGRGHYNHVKFEIFGGQGDPGCQSPTDDDERNSQTCQPKDPTLLLEEEITIGGVVEDLAVAEIDGSVYVVPDEPTHLYKWEGNTLSLVNTLIPGPSNRASTEFFFHGQTPYLAIGGSTSVSTHNDIQLFAGWNGTTFTSRLPTLHTGGPQSATQGTTVDIEVFDVQNQKYLIANAGNSDQVTLFRWTGTQFDTQPLEVYRTGGDPMDLEIMQINGETYLGFADRNAPSGVYRWNSTRNGGLGGFDPNQNVLATSIGGSDMETFTIGGQHYLALSFKDGDPQLFRWNGQSFVRDNVSEGDFRGAGASLLGPLHESIDDFHFVLAGNVPMLFRAAQEGQVFLWDGSEWKLSTLSNAIPQTQHGGDAESFRKNGHFVASVGRYTAGTSVSQSVLRVYRVGDGELCPSHSQAQCSDGMDNDGDGLVDLSDPQCESAQDDDESGGVCQGVTNGLILDVDAQNIDGNNNAADSGDIRSVWTDLTGNGNHLTLNGFALPGNGQSGWRGNNTVASPSSLQFNGSAFLRSAAKQWGFSTNGTVCAWVKPHQGTGHGTIFSLAHGYIQNEFLLFGGSFLSVLNHSHPHNYFQRHSALPQQEWSYICGSMNGGGTPDKLRIFLNGQEEAGATRIVNSPTEIVDTHPRAITVGVRNPTEEFVGEIARLQVYNRPLSESEVRRNYEVDHGRFYSNPQFCQTQSQCSDGVDNDGDGAIDLADFSCNSGSDPDETNPKSQCQDHLDNDGDGLIDLNDPGCQSLQDNDEFNQPASQCSDGVDNDGDGLTDLQDPGCSGSGDDSERNPNGPQCDNGRDDDGDGRVDFPQDGDCDSPFDDDESAVQCSVQPTRRYTNATLFRNDSGATGVGPYPSTPHHASSVAVGTATVSNPGGGPNLVTSDQLAAYANPLPGLSLLVSGKEDIDITFPAPIYGFGFDFYEAHNDTVTANTHVANIVDSTFEVTLFNGGTSIDSFTFNAPNDVVSFQGIWSEQQFNRVEIREIHGTNDNEVFGTIYTTRTPPPFCPVAQCSDGQDNDSDGLVDLNDPGCSSGNDDSERNPNGPQCDNGRDDDGDGRVDFPQDGDCDSPFDGTEQTESTEVSVDKKFSVNNGITFFEHLTGNRAVGPGEIITERIYYDNRSTEAFSATSVKATLPPGFTLIPGSTRNCIAPSDREIVCSTDDSQNGPIAEHVVWNGQDLNISPTAGLYDISPSQTQGILEMGKKRYLNFQNCDYVNNIVHNTDDNFAFEPGNTAKTQLTCLPATQGSSLRPTPPHSQRDPVDIMGHRYANAQNCDYVNNVVHNTDDRLLFTPSNNAHTSQQCDPATPNTSFRPQNSTFSANDHLGKRYLNFQNCDYVNNIVHNTDDNVSFDPSNTPITAQDCRPATPGTSFRPQHSTFDPIDLLDTNRGRGFIEFKMQATTTPGTYTQTAHMHDPNFGVVQDTGDIEVQSSGACQDGLDNDGDGLIDLQDPGCSSGGDDSERNPNGPQCDNGRDDDGDGRVDFPFDSGCVSPTDTDERNAVSSSSSSSAVSSSSSSAPTGCSDGVDNDGDGLIDLQDPGCSGSGDGSERDPHGPQCDNGRDDDGDGRVDFPQDAGCSSPWDADESSNTAPECSDGVDNDGDGAVDMNDFSCSSGSDDDERNPRSQCQDGIDNDGDGLVDLNDPDCSDGQDNGEAPSTTQCNDGVDNDGDGHTDWPQDPGCSSTADTTERNPSGPACDNGIDDDNDGLVDFPADVDCAHIHDDTEGEDESSFELDLTVRDDRDPVAPGERFSYEIRVCNEGDEDIELDVRAELDEDVRFERASDDGDEDDEDVVWEDVEIDADDCETLDLNVRVIRRVSDGERLRLRVRASDEREDEYTEVIDEGFGGFGGIIGGFGGEPGIGLVTVDKQADRSEVQPGSTLSYTVTVRNNGGGIVEGIVVEDQYTTGALSVVDPGSGTSYGNGITWHVSVLGPGESRVLQYRARVSHGMRHGQIINNTVRVQGIGFDRTATDTAVVSVIERLPQTGQASFAQSHARDTVHLRLVQTGDAARELPGTLWATVIIMGLGIGGTIGRKLLI